MTLSLLKKFAIAGAMIASAVCVARAQTTITVDGTLDGAYGAPLTVQTINTSGTDNQNELDAAYAVASGTNLYVFIAGNAHTSGNRMVLFIADGRTGQSTFSYPGALAITHLNGSVFNSDFQATFAMDFNLGSGILTLSEFFMANGTNFGGAAGSFSLTNGIGSGAPNNQHFAAPITVALNNNNTAGIIASSSGTAASQAAATAVTRGYELVIPLVLLGNPTSGVKVMVFETGSLDNGPIFNQFLPGLPVGTTTFALGGPYTGTTTSLFNFGSRPNEWFPVAVSGVSVALTSPTNNASYIPGSDVVLTANASDLSGSITNVDYYSGSTRLGNATSSPYSFTWAGVPAGSYGLTAVAVNSAGLSATSSVVNITVAWVAPTVSITAPANNANFTSGATIAISANAAEVSGVITNVAFYANSSLLGNAASAPYSVNWRVLAAGSYALTAVASDSRGLSVTSAVVNISVTLFVAYDDASAYGGWTSGANFGFGFQPWILNGAGQYVGFITQTSLHIDTSSKSWGMYANGTGSPYAIAYRGFNNGLATGQTFGVRFQNAYLNQGAMGFCLRSDTNNTSFSDTSIIQDSGTRFAFYIVGGQSEYYVWDGNGAHDTGIGITTTGLSLKLELLTADTYALTVQTADGSTTLATFPSAPLAGAPGSAVQMFAGLNIGTGGNQNAVFNNLQVTIPAPVISLTSPANNANFAPGIGIAITANATESGGAISDVAFYADSILIGNAASAPFSFTWSGAPVGTHTLTAVATDTDGYATISLPVTITVGPMVTITSPANNASFIPGSNIPITVNATETGGVITNVAFYSGSIRLGNDATSPYSFTWTSVPVGNHALTAVATDSAGVSATSAVVNVSVVMAFVPNQIKTVFMIPLENHDWQQGCPTCSPQQILDNPAAPYVNSLITPGNPNAAQVSYAIKYYMSAHGGHPSEPNYIWSEAGTEFGTHVDDDPSTSSGNLFSTANHLSRQLTDAGIAWKDYIEDLEYSSGPTHSATGTRSDVNSYNGSIYYDYAVKHNPMQFFTDTQNQNAYTLAKFWLDLTNNAIGRYNWIQPDSYNEMHTSLPSFDYHGNTYSGDQGAIASGDNFLSIVVPKIMASAAYQDHGVIIIWTDETESSDDTNTSLPFIVISPMAKGNAYACGVVLSHSSTLKMMDEIFGLAFQTNAIVTASYAAQGPGIFNYVDGRSATINDLSDMFAVPRCAPVLVSQPACVTNCAGTAASFTIGATSCGQLSYQWYLGLGVLMGETNSTLSIPSVGPTNAGNYQVVVTSDGIATNSTVATLTVSYQAPQLVGGQMLPAGGGYQLQFSGPSGQTYQVLASSDLTLPVSQWTVVGSGTFSGQDVFFSDISSAGSRFYVIRSP